MRAKNFSQTERAVTDQSSPLLEQYRRIKRDHRGEVLFFRLGDFYEMFAEDAVEVSALLNLTLTSRNGLPMCGVPYHAARGYIARLLRAGKKVAICEQLTEPSKGKTIIERQVVEVVTPGTTVDEDYLDKGSANYLACIAVPATAGDGVLSFAYIDLSTGGFFATAFSGARRFEKLAAELERTQARELVVQESLIEGKNPVAAAADRSGIVVNRWADWLFDGERAASRLKKQFGVSSLKGFGLEDSSAELPAAGALLDYLDDTAKSLIPHVRSITVYSDDDYMGIDESTQRNLELVRNLRDGERQFSLLEILDETKTAMGRRLLVSRLLRPLLNVEQIRRRADMVETFYRSQQKLNGLRELLAKTADLERLSSRLAMDKAHGKDMLAVKNALALFAGIETLCHDLPLEYESPAARALGEQGLNRLADLEELLAEGICDDPSILLTEGNLIRSGYDEELDGLVKLRDSGRQLLEAYLEEEREATGISSLKIRYNRLIGYFFEVTKAQLSRVPAHFIRRQGIVTGERFTTDRLAALESDINGASDRIIELERKLFIGLRDKAKERIEEIAAAARRMAELDYAQSLARAATVRGWTRPVLDGENRIDVREGRHPVVEAHLPRGEFIPNDIQLDCAGVAFALITGPNMAGKSTYLRQAALICVMAQIGSFVPASEARLGICDRIFCRVGASDNLARGESTFLSEMTETAYILHTATERSLVIMDEVGRGTGTRDGLSIAWAVSEDLLNRVRCRTLFATHYHELAALNHPRLANRSMEVLDEGEGIVFLRRLKEGAAVESYGLHAASLAGLPQPVLDRAAAIMAAPANAPASAVPEPSAGTLPAPSPADNPVLRELAALDLDTLTPLEALNTIARWKAGTAADMAGPPRKPPRSKPHPNDTPSLFD